MVNMEQVDFYFMREEKRTLFQNCLEPLDTTEFETNNTISKEAASFYLAKTVKNDLPLANMLLKNDKLKESLREGIERNFNRLQTSQTTEELCCKIEKVFDFLVTQANKKGIDVDRILEISDVTGETCYKIASKYSEKISNYIIGRRILVNSIDSWMNIPSFKYPSLSIQMMNRGINPHVIDLDGYSQVDYHPSSFESEEAKRLLSTFP